jgi:hypothetical protein
MHLHDFMARYSFTFGLWFHTNSQGEIVEGHVIKEAIPDGYCILPGYRIVIDLGAAAVTTAIWWGGMDVHCTTVAQAKPNTSVTCWGMSIQTHKNIVKGD